MPKPTLALKSSVARRPAVPDADERALQAEHHQAAAAVEAIEAIESVAAAITEPATPEQPAQARESEKSGLEPEKSEKPPKHYDPHALQSAFLCATKDRVVILYLLNGIKLIGKLRQFDQYCVLLEGADGMLNLIFKSAISTIQVAVR